MKRKIGRWDCVKEVLEALPAGGVLLTARDGDKVNPMTIGWGTLGIEWGTPIFIVFVRQNRYTRQMLDKNPEFTISAPYGGTAKEILALCGTKSGRDIDKVTEAGLTVETPEIITVPGFRELPLTLECQVIYRQEQDPDAIEAGLLRRYYPQDVDSSFPGANRDFHIAYYGEIVSSYIIE